MESEGEHRLPRAGLAPGSASPSGGATRWVRVKAVFLEALELPEGERSAFVARACAEDGELKAEVESLLASEAAAGSFISSPAAELLGRGSPSLREAPRLSPGARLASYEIVRFVAAGGMGEVYLARHLVLGREVALKTVHPTAGADGVRRLLREARHASTLKHPNICTIHEVGESPDGPFIAMEYVDGRPLSDIVRDGVPRPDRALEYGIQVAAALEHAHGRGIVHRDLKSSNIVVDADGRAIVLDFGLARRLPGSVPGGTESTLTQQGALAGTLSHMAPEVLLGRSADARSDVWALGVVLYELATGRLPFQGRTPYETSSAVLGEAPRPIGRGVPLALRLVIERCLMKDPAARYPTAAQVRAALEAIRRRRSWPVVGRLLVSMRRRTLGVAAAALVLGGAAVSAAVAFRPELMALTRPEVSTLALLPLAQPAGGGADQYYLDGVTDALIEQLGAAIDVRVISRVSAERVARTASSSREIGRRLGAAALAQGVLARTRGDRLRLSMRLVSPSDGHLLWSETFERPAGEVLALEADVVRALALEVRLDLRPGARERLGAVRAVAPEVYEAYLKGRYEWNQRTQASLQRAIEHFRRAVELDPTYAPAHAALADCYNQLGTVMVGIGSPKQFRPLAAAEAIKALQIDPYSAEAHAALGYVRHYDWQWADAERELRRAIELNPSFALAHVWYANLLSSVERPREALQQALLARELDPFSLVVATNVGWTLQMAGEHARAIEEFRRALALDSTYIQARWRLAQSLSELGRTSEALEEASRVVALAHRSSSSLAQLADIEIRAGQLDAARAIAAELLERARHEYVPPYSLGGVLEGLGRRREALAWMVLAIDERSNGLAYLSPESGAGPLHDDPRFRALLAAARRRQAQR